MAFRLVGQLNNKRLQLSLQPGSNLVGSASECSVRIEHPTVSRTHAEVSVSADRVVVKDLESRNGTFVGNRRISSAEIAPGTTVAFGHVRLALEEVTEEDLEVALSLAGGTVPLAGPATTTGSTIHTKPVETFTIEKLPALLRLLAEGADETRLAQAGGSALFETLPVLAVEVTTQAGGQTAVLFEARREIANCEGVPFTAGDDELGLRVTFAETSGSQTFSALVDSVTTLVRLGSGQRKAQRAKHPQTPPPTPEPPTVVAEVGRIYEEAARVARGDIGILIVGESGTGKEVLARFVHAASPRAQGSFVALNCAALPRDLLETELFGIEKGVATGVDARAGKFELAHGGTLLLDEIGDMSLDTQAKILRVLQEGEVYRLGGSGPRKAAVRIVAATNRDVERLLAEGRFREDLYYRIATWTVQLPPLRARPADIPNLAAYFLTREAERAGVRAKGISRAALDRLIGYEWPGNIRQLEKEIARAVLFLGDGELLDTSRLSPHVRQMAAGSKAARLSDVLERVEREEILGALKRCEGDVEKAAEALGLGRSTLYRRMKALGIEPP